MYAAPHTHTSCMRLLTIHAHTSLQNIKIELQQNFILFYRFNFNFNLFFKFLYYLFIYFVFLDLIFYRLDNGRIDGRNVAK